MSDSGEAWVRKKEESKSAQDGGGHSKTMKERETMKEKPQRSKEGDKRKQEAGRN